jgi:hypothetical protein
VAVGTGVEVGFGVWVRVGVGGFGVGVGGFGVGVGGFGVGVGGIAVGVGVEVDGTGVAVGVGGASVAVSQLALKTMNPKSTANNNFLISMPPHI